MPSRPMASRPSGGLWHAAVDPRGRGSAAARMRLRTAMAGTFAPATAVQRRIHVYSQGVHKVPQSVDNPGGVLKPTVLIGLHGSPPRPASARAKSRAGHSDTSLSRATGLLAGRIVWNEREPAALRDKGFLTAGSRPAGERAGPFGEPAGIKCPLQQSATRALIPLQLQVSARHTTAGTARAGSPAPRAVHRGARRLPCWRASRVPPRGVQPVNHTRPVCIKDRIGLRLADVPGPQLVHPAHHAGCFHAGPVIVAGLSLECG